MLQSIANRAADFGSIAKSMAVSSVELAVSAGAKASETIKSTSDAILVSADKIGITKGVNEVSKLASKSAKETNAKASRLLADSNKAVLKARRLANKTLDLEEDVDENYDSSDFDLLLTAEGSATSTLAIYATFSQVYTVPAGSAFVYKCRVKKWDIGFGVKEKREKDSIDIEPVIRYESNQLIKGVVPASAQPRSLTLFFDNSYSQLQRKKVAYWVAIGPNASLTDDGVGTAREMEVTAAEEGPSMIIPDMTDTLVVEQREVTSKSELDEE